jgi:hypothetical protein
VAFGIAQMLQLVALSIPPRTRARTRSCAAQSQGLQAQFQPCFGRFASP